MNKRKIGLITGCCAVVGMAFSAELVLNGDMSAVAYANGGNNADFGDLNQGWAVKSTTAISLASNPGEMTWTGPTDTLLEDALAQVNSLTSETGSIITLSFDWTPALGASSTNTSLDYQLIGWITNAPPAATDVFFKNINGDTKKVAGLSGNANVIDLLSGMDHGTGEPTPSYGTVSGSAGVTTHAAVEVDLSGYSHADISDFDYIGIRFSIAGDQADLTAAGSTLDNVSLMVEGEAAPDPPGHTGVVTVADFYTDTISSVDQTVNITEAPYHADGSDAADDSSALQAAIDDMTALPNGGKVIIPAGTFYMSGVYLKSNVHLVIDPSARLITSGTVAPVFYFGLDSSGVDAMTTISNVSIRSASSGRYTVDLRPELPNPNKAQFVRCWNVKNFMIADFRVLDNITKLSSVTMNTAEYSGQWFQPRDGVVINGHVVDAHYGYGLIQAQACTNILFQDLSGVGGITLRLETGAVPYDAPLHIKLHEIYGRNISITNGHGAAMLGPHYRINGHVDLDGVTAVASLYAVSAGDGFVNMEEEAAGYLPGYFADTCVIKNVHAVYGENAGYKTKNFNDIPCEERHKISAGPVYSGIIYRGPSSIAVYSNTTRVAFSNVTQEGFLYRTHAIMSKADEIDSCAYVPVTGITLSNPSLQLHVAKTAFLSTTISPAAPSDPTVMWHSDNPAVAVVGVGGVVMAVSEGSATITGTTLDGGFSDDCVVTVSGGGGGSWSELLNDDFESGWGNWQDGWANFAGNASEAALTNANAVGTQCAYLMGDVSNSVISLNAPLDLTAYSNLKIAFTYVASGFNALQDFWVQISADNGITWQMIDDLVLGKDFSNGVRTNATLIIDRERYNFSSESRLRIGCDKINGGDHVYVDDIVVSYFEQTGWGKRVEEQNLSGDANADADGDGQSDLVEYALGGDAANPAIQGALPYSTSVAGTISFFHERLTNSNSGVSYSAEWTEDLVDGAWKTNWGASFIGISTNPGFVHEEYQQDWSSMTNMFLRLRIEQP